MDVISSLPSSLDLASASQRTEINLNSVTDQIITIKTEDRPAASPAESTTLSQDAKYLSRAETLAKKLAGDAEDNVIDRLTGLFTATMSVLRRDLGEGAVSDFTNNFDSADGLNSVSERRYNKDVDSFLRFQDLMLQTLSATEIITGKDRAELHNLPDAVISKGLNLDQLQSFDQEILAAIESMEKKENEDNIDNSDNTSQIT